MKELRDLLPFLHGIHYLNYGATSPVLLPSIEVWKRLVEDAKEPLYFHRDAWFSHLEKARRSVSELICASPEEIAFVSNTSSGLSLVANAIRWKEGDQILYLSDEFPSNRYVWDNLREKGVQAIRIEPLRGFSFAEQMSSIDLSRVRLIAVSAVSYADGRRHDIGALAKLCKAKEILLAVDAVQAVGAIPVNVKAWDCDFLASGGQKWLFGPVGTGFLYIKKERIEELFVPQVGWASSRYPRDYEHPTLQFTDGARRFEPGLSDIPAIAALAESIETMKRIGQDKIHGRIEQLVQAARNGFMELGIEPLTPERASGILAVPMKEGIGQRLIENKIYATERNGRLRISLHASATEEDLAALFKTLSGISKRIDLLPPSSKSLPPPSGKRALVTGASSGLGKAVAIELAKRGYSLLLASRRKSKLETLAQELRDTYGIAAEPFLLDLSDAEAVSKAAFDVDFLANCAADADAELFSEIDFTSMRSAFEVNFFAPVTLTQKIVKKGSGTILNIVTGGGRCALPLFGSYSAAKGAFWSWSESLQRETAGTKVSVTTFLPPHMDSDTSMKIGRKALAYYSLGRSDKKADPTQVAKEAVSAALEGRPFAASLKTRFKIALNNLWPSILNRTISRRWKQH